jgi:hypothetical protein
MGKAIQKHQRAGEILSLNIEDLDVVELEHRLEMAVALSSADVCIVNHSCSCGALASCGTFCG